VEKCVTCHYYDRRSTRGVDGRTCRSGQCRRTAPLLSPVSSKAYQIEGVWPTVRDDDWCGEWKVLPRRAMQFATAACQLADRSAVASLAAPAGACNDEAAAMAAD
jgi:hypothetical protein